MIDASRQSPYRFGVTFGGPVEPEEFFRIQSLFAGGEIEANDTVNQRTLRGPIKSLQLVHGRVFIHHEWMAVHQRGWEIVNDAPTTNFPLERLVPSGKGCYRAVVNNEGVYLLTPALNTERLNRGDVRDAPVPGLRLIK